MRAYVSRWNKALAGCAGIREPWHADVVRAQFVVGEASAATRDFIAFNVYGRPLSVPLEDREEVARMAVAALTRAGYPVGPVSCLWFPRLWSEQYAA